LSHWRGLKLDRWAVTSQEYAAIGGIIVVTVPAGFNESRCENPTRPAASRRGCDAIPRRRAGGFPVRYAARRVASAAGNCAIA
jgi:hypothetical protein